MKRSLVRIRSYIPYFMANLINYFYNSKIRVEGQNRITDLNSTKKECNKTGHIREI